MAVRFQNKTLTEIKLMNVAVDVKTEDIKKNFEKFDRVVHTTRFTNILIFHVNTFSGAIKGKLFLEKIKYDQRIKINVQTPIQAEISHLCDELVYMTHQ